MTTIVVTDSSDDEIQFFSASTSKPKENEDNEVIFCGVRKANKKSQDIVEKRNKGGLSLLSKDVTVRSIRVGRNVEAPPQPDSDPDVEFLGVQKRQNQPDIGSTRSVSEVSDPRARSDSFNININSQKSLNTNLTIDIDAKTNKKKVQLTFLGPCPRDEFIPSSPQIMNRTAFKPLEASTPNVKTSSISPNITLKEPLINQNNRQCLPISSTPQVTSISGATKSNENESPISIINPKFYTRIHSNSIFQKNNRNHILIKDKNSIKASNLNKTLDVGNNLTASTSNAHKVIDCNKEKESSSTSSKQEEKRCRTELVKEADSNPINSDLSKNKVEKSIEKTTNKMSKDETPENSKFQINFSNKNISDCSSNSKKMTKISCTSTEKKKKEELNFPGCSYERIESNSNKKASKAGSSEVTKIRDISPVAGPSRQDSEDSSSSDSQDEVSNSKQGHRDSTSESSDDEPVTRVAMPKSALDALFYKFLDNCTNVSTKQEVVKMKMKMKKLYLSTPNAVKNEDFILTLKEVSLRIEKPLRSPLDLMKKVFAQLRIDSPDNKKNIKKLENVLEQVQKKIKQFEEAEVTSDEDEIDNVYLKLDRYRRRAVQIYNKLCELRSVPADAERPTLRNVSFQGVAPDEFSKSTTVQNLVIRVSRALEKYYNKSHKFPDFQDVRALMSKLSLESGSKLKSETLHQLARSLFEEFGDMLQKRRLYDDYKICSEYLDEDQEDPYYEDPILAAKLDANRKSRRKEKEVLNQYTYKQTILKEKGISDSYNSSENSSEIDSEEENDKKNQSSSDEKSESDKNDIVKKRRIVSSNSSSDSETIKSHKGKKKVSDVTKETKISSSNQNKGKKSKIQDADNHVDECKNKRNYSKLSESNDSSRKKIRRKSDETVQNITTESKEISIERVGDDTIRYHDYKNNSTRIVDDTSPVDRGVVQHRADKNIENNKNDDVICLDEADEPTNNQNPLTGTDHLHNPQNQLFSNSSEQNPTSQSTYFANNSCGIRITNVTTCQETFTSQNEIQEVVICSPPSEKSPPFILVSDDEPEPEQHTSNTLSQKEILELMPIILGRTK